MRLIALLIALASPALAEGDPDRGARVYEG